MKAHPANEAKQRIYGELYGKVIPVFFTQEQGDEPKTQQGNSKRTKLFLGKKFYESGDNKWYAKKKVEKYLFSFSTEDKAQVKCLMKGYGEQTSAAKEIILVEGGYYDDSNN